MNNASVPAQAVRVMYCGTMLIFFLIPFHAFFTTWLGSIFGNRTLWQSWKEVVIVILALTASLCLWRDFNLRRFLFGSKINQMIIVYGVLHLLLALMLRTGIIPLIFSLKYNVSFLLLYILTQIVVYYSPKDVFSKKLAHIVLGASIIVAAFGLLQALFLPKDFLTHFGYGKNTILPYLPLQIDATSENVRVFSTLGGANQLGSFLLLPLALVLHLAMQQKKYLWLLVAGVFLAVEFFTYSRSAWVGVFAVLAIIFLNKVQKRMKFLLLTLFVIFILAAGMYITNNIESNRFAQVVFLHSNTKRVFTDSSNSLRLRAMKEGVETVISHPFGIGPGEAGPATWYTKKKPIIQENYYLQIAAELGILGALVFLALSIMVGFTLWKRSKENELALPLLASFVGVMLVNMVLHGWADTSTALVWWGLAGAVIKTPD